jgi:hypothetical protein
VQSLDIEESLQFNENEKDQKQKKTGPASLFQVPTLVALVTAKTESMPNSDVDWAGLIAHCTKLWSARCYLGRLRKRNN